MPPKQSSTASSSFFFVPSPTKTGLGGKKSPRLNIPIHDSWRLHSFACSQCKFCELFSLRNHNNRTICRSANCNFLKTVLSVNAIIQLSYQRLRIILTRHWRPVLCILSWIAFIKNSLTGFFHLLLVTLSSFDEIRRKTIFHKAGFIFRADYVYMESILILFMFPSLPYN